MVRHENTVSSVESTIRLLLENHLLPLRIQEELVNEHMDISETGAGGELNQGIDAQIRRYQEEVRMFREEMEKAMEDKDEETRVDSQRLESDYKKEMERLEARIQQLWSDARKGVDRVTAECQGQIDDTKSTLRTNTAASEVARKAPLPAQLEGLLVGSLFSKIAFALRHLM